MEGERGGITSGCLAMMASSPLKSGGPGGAATMVSGVSLPAARMGGSGTPANFESIMSAPPATLRSWRAPPPSPPCSRGVDAPCTPCPLFPNAEPFAMEAGFSAASMREASHARAIPSS